MSASIWSPSYGTPVQAVADGRVEYAGWCGELGRCVRLDHSQGMVSIYGHLSQITPGLDRGEWVSLGEVIGRVGTSGLSTGPHLHFALERDGHYINPLTENIGVNHQVSPRMRSLFEQFKDNYLAMLSKLPDLGGHFHVGAAEHPRCAGCDGWRGRYASGGRAGHASAVAPSWQFVAHCDWSAEFSALAVARSALDSDFFDLPDSPRNRPSRRERRVPRKYAPLLFAPPPRPTRRTSSSTST